MSAVLRERALRRGPIPRQPATGYLLLLRAVPGVWVVMGAPDDREVMLFLSETSAFAVAAQCREVTQARVVEVVVPLPDGGRLFGDLDLCERDLRRQLRARARVQAEAPPPVPSGWLVVLQTPLIPVPSVLSYRGEPWIAGSAEGAEARAVPVRMAGLSATVWALIGERPTRVPTLYPGSGTVN